MNDTFRRWLARLWTPPNGDDTRLSDDDLGAYENEMTRLEQEQREIDARLRLLGRQGDPRGWRGD